MTALISASTALVIGVSIVIVSVVFAVFIAVQYLERRRLAALAAEERRRQILLAAHLQAKAWARHGYL